MAKRRRRTPVVVTPRPLNEGENVRAIIRDELTKALALPAGAQVTNYSQGYLQALQQQNAMRPRPGSATLTRDPNNGYPFGPGDPLVPAPIGPPMASGRAAPQLWDYPVGWNLAATDTRMVPWSVLRDVSSQIPVVRACIDACKSALTGLDWSFSIDSARARALAKRANTSSHAVIADLQDKYADDIDRLHTWWQKPDRIRNLNFVEWLTALLEDEVCLDAVSIYPHLTLGGELHSAELIDSTMIKPLLDIRGAPPQPPYAAYQQIRMGFPRGEYRQFESENPVDREFVSAVYGRPQGISAPTDVLIYKVRNQRTDSPYGLSAVEKALPAVDMWLKRWDWLGSEYSSGVTPEMIVKVAGNYTPEQLRGYESVFNDDLSGRSEERHRAKFLPDGFEALFPSNMDAKFASDFDLHVIRLICAALDVLPTSIGFTPNHGMGGMGGQGHQQGEKDSQLERGTKPRAKWVVDLINEISVNYLGMPPEVTFTFHGLDDEDEQRRATLLEGYVKNGLMVLNEGRDSLNLPRYAIEQANEPFISTPTGPAFFNPKVQPVGMPGNLPSAPQNGPQTADEGPAAIEGAPSNDGDDTPSRADDARSEQKAFASFAQRRAGRAGWRDFVFKHHEPDIAEAANRLAEVGELDAAKAALALTAH